MVNYNHNNRKYHKIKMPTLININRNKINKNKIYNNNNKINNTYLKYKSMIYKI